MDCVNPKESTVAGLPADALAEILFRLPIKPLLRSRCVARAWRDLIDDPLRRTRFRQTLQGFLLVDETYGSSDGGHLGFVDLRRRPAVPLDNDIDPSFSFLTSLPGVEFLTLSDSCNGLLLFENGPGDPMLVSGYFVCNPATKGWGEVPTCDCPPPGFDEARYTYVLFDPAISDHFHLVQFRDTPYQMMHEEFYITVHAYSSETETWSCSECDWKTEEEQGQLEWWRHQGLTPYEGHLRAAFVNGILHFVILDQYKIVAVDVQGKTRGIIPLPATVEGERWPLPGYIAESQGRLHYINHEPVAHDSEQSPCVYIWVLNDYDAREWVLLDTVSFLELFGEQSSTKWNFRAVSIHPDCNVVFFVLSESETLTTPTQKLISYVMSHKEVSVVGTFENERHHRHVVPYVPCFTESPALTNMH